MAKKKIKEEDEKYQVIDLSLKVEKRPVHNNDMPMEQRMKENGAVEFSPPDQFCSCRIGKYDDTWLGYEIQARQYEKDMFGSWAKGKKWTTVGYLLYPRFSTVHWLARSPWLSDQLGVLMTDVQDFERIMKERILHHNEDVAAKMKAWKEEQDVQKAAK